MRHMVLLAILTAACLVGSGCLDGPSRDIENEAKEREKYAKEQNDFDVIAVLSGPATIAPGALVWYSAYGSHDPDFLGATTADLRDDEPATDGKVQYRDDATDVEFSWYVPLYERSNDDLGTGIRTYEWQLDDGPVLHSYDLTYRYGSEDGPLRFPVGFPEPGAHTLRMTVTGWDGSRDSAEIEVLVEGSGTGSTVGDWEVTHDGWVHNRSVELEPEDFGECPGGSSGYDPAFHDVRVPWDLVYWMHDVSVAARWETVGERMDGSIPGGLPFEPPVDMNVADVDLTLGHCATDDVWKRIYDEPGPTSASPRVEGSASGAEFVDHMEVEGKRIDKSATWHWNAFHSTDGMQYGGVHTPVEVSFTFHPASDTRSGGL